MSKEVVLAALSDQQKEEVIKLWNNEYPAVFELAGLPAYEAVVGILENQEHLYISDDSGALVAWFVLFDYEGERWFILLLDRSIQRKGEGSRILSWAKERSTNLQGWIVVQAEMPMSDGLPYPIPAEFYRKNGFEVKEDIHWEAVPFATNKVSWFKEA